MWTQKQLAKSNKSQVPTQPQEKSNKQASVTKSVQASIVQIQVGCTTKVYWVDNSKTCYLTVEGSGSGFFVDSNGYIITMLMSLTSLRIQISASKAILKYRSYTASSISKRQQSIPPVRLLNLSNKKLW